jgi:hypothetical protein
MGLFAPSGSVVPVAIDQNEEIRHWSFAEAHDEERHSYGRSVIRPVPPHLGMRFA